MVVFGPLCGVSFATTCSLSRSPAFSRIPNEWRGGAARLLLSGMESLAWERAFRTKQLTRRGGNFRFRFRLLFCYCESAVRVRVCVHLWMCGDFKVRQQQQRQHNERKRKRRRRVESEGGEGAELRQRRDGDRTTLTVSLLRVSQYIFIAAVSSKASKQPNRIEHPTNRLADAKLHWEMHSIKKFKITKNPNRKLTNSYTTFQTR